jgi:hypothetical protein
MCSDKLKLTTSHQESEHPLSWQYRTDVFVTCDTVFVRSFVIIQV